MLEIKNKEELTEVLKNKHVIVYFGAEWCPPCKALMPRMEQIATNNPDLVVAHIDVDVNQDLASEYEVRSIPILFFVKEGRIMERQVGGLSAGGLNVRVKSFLEN